MYLLIVRCNLKCILNKSGIFAMQYKIFLMPIDFNGNKEKSTYISQLNTHLINVFENNICIKLSAK